MTALAAQWVVAFSAAVAASAICWGVYSVKEAVLEFLTRFEETEARSRVNQHAIRSSECVQLPARPLSTPDEESA